MRLGAPLAPSSLDCTTPFWWLLFCVLTSMVIAGTMLRALQEKSGVGKRRRMYRLRARPLQGQWQQRSMREVWEGASMRSGGAPIWLFRGTAKRRCGRWATAAWKQSIHGCMYSH